MSVMKSAYNERLVEQSLEWENDRWWWHVENLAILHGYIKYAYDGGGAMPHEAFGSIVHSALQKVHEEKNLEPLMVSFYKDSK